jgi:hypothetical protein
VTQKREYLFYVRCQQDTGSVGGVYHTEEVSASSGPEALQKVREMFLPRLKRETRLSTRGPRLARYDLKITMAELKQAREPKPVQLELPI